MHIFAKYTLELYLSELSKCRIDIEFNFIRIQSLK